MMLGVAILGTGRLGGRYIEKVRNTDGADIRVVAEPLEEKAAPHKKANPDIDFVADYKDALARDDVDIVIGTLPHYLHHRAAVDAASAGKHVFLEKPMATSVAECDEMIAAARANKVLLMTAHTQRYMPVVRKMKEVVDSRVLGDLVMVHSVWHKPYDPEGRPAWMFERSQGGGMGMMDGTHMIDRLLWILGPDVATVSAMVGTFTYPEFNADDTAMCFLRWKSGRVATMSRMAWREGITEYGADYFFTDGQARLRIAYGRGPGQLTGFWLSENREWKQVQVEEIDPLQEEFADFVRAIERGDSDAPVPMTHGRQVIEVFEATERSSKLGREVTLGGQGGV